MRDWALPSGAWRPFDLHEDTFATFPHGCAVQMIYRSFTKRPSVSQQRQGVLEDSPQMTVAQIGEELDDCFEELGYKSDKLNLVPMITWLASGWCSSANDITLL